MSVKIATWNLCLGLPNKKDTVLRVLESEKIDICCLQETEIDENYPTNILSSPSYELELERNTGKKSWCLRQQTFKIYKKRRS